MLLILHQLKTDCRRFRIVLLFYLAVLAAQASLPRLLFSGAPGSILHWVEWITAVTLTGAVIQADPLAETTSFWMTRPVRRLHLFWSKAAFIVFVIALPFFISESTVWVRWMGFDFGLWLRATAEMALYAVFALSLVAAVSSLRKGATKVLILLGTLAGVFALWWAFLQYLSSRGVIQMMGHSVMGHSNFEWMNRTTVTWLALCVFVVLAWVLQACAGRSRAALWLLFCALLFVLPIYHLWPARLLPFRGPIAFQPKANLVVLKDADALDAPPGSQLLWSHFRIDGLKSNQVATVGSLSGWFTPPKGTPLQLFDSGWMRNHVLANVQVGDFWKTVESSLPAGTFWFGSINRVHDDMLPVLRNQPLIIGKTTSVAGDQPPLDDNTFGRLEGQLIMGFWDVRKVADLPIEPGAFSRNHGQTFDLGRIKKDQQGIELDLAEGKPNLLFDPNRNPDTSDSNEPQIFVLYQPSCGEAFVVSRPHDRASTLLAGQFVDEFTLSFPYPALRAKLTGVSVEDWLKGARLEAFEPVFAGMKQFAFNETNYNLRVNRREDARTARGAAGLTAIDALELPAQPSAAEIRSYLETIMANLPRTITSDDIQRIRRKVNAIGTNGLSEILDLSADMVFGNLFVRPFLRQATRDQLPELRQALKRQPSLVFLFQEKHWEADARDILLSILPDHRKTFDPIALTIVAQAKNPATYADLSWHIARLEYLTDDLLAALRECPGFDLSSAIALLWKRAQLGLAQRDPSGSITLAAAEQGLPEAFVQAVALVESPGQPDWGRLALPRLLKMTDYSGPADEFRPWLLAHFEQLRFDSTKRRYVLNES